MRRSASVALFVGMLAMAAGLAAFAGANGTHDATITVTAAESGCPTPKTFCWEFDADEVHGGGTLTITAVNADGNSDHNFFVDTTGDYDDGHANSDASAAEESVDLPSGATEDVMVDVAADATAIYFWCDISGHETLGMWGELEVAAGDDGMTNGEEDDEEGSPAVGLFAALVGISLAAFALSRRR